MIEKRKSKKKKEKKRKITEGGMSGFYIYTQKKNFYEKLFDQAVIEREGEGLKEIL